RIGNYIGRTVCLDLAIAAGVRARVSVEVDFTKPLVGRYAIDDRVFHVEYESLENIYFGCGLCGDRLESS
ncbi:hypothetical protein LINPERPRIM_LOCUS20860, partial [Linum perenne]